MSMWRVYGAVLVALLLGALLHHLWSDWRERRRAKRIWRAVTASDGWDKCGLAAFGLAPETTKGTAVQPTSAAVRALLADNLPPLRVPVAQRRDHDRCAWCGAERGHTECRHCHMPLCTRCLWAHDCPAEDKPQPRYCPRCGEAGPGVPVLCLRHLQMVLRPRQAAVLHLPLLPVGRDTLTPDEQN